MSVFETFPFKVKLSIKNQIMLGAGERISWIQTFFVNFDKILSDKLISLSFGKLVGRYQESNQIKLIK